VAEKEEGINEHKRIQELYGPGHSLESDELYEDWDKLYGIGSFSYSVYMLTDSTRPIRIQFSPFLQLNHQPFYVGHGIYGKRAKQSMGVGRQQDKYGFKRARLNEIEARGGKARDVYIGHFLTKVKAQLVERKIMNLSNMRSFLENGELNFCEIPLTASDCNVIYNRSSTKKVITL
jgi:hypothetical protein